MDQFMKAALDEAHAGAAEGGIPIGAALVDKEGHLVATGRNRRIQVKPESTEGRCERGLLKRQEGVPLNLG